MNGQGEEEKINRMKSQVVTIQLLGQAYNCLFWNVILKLLILEVPTPVCTNIVYLNSCDNCVTNKTNVVTSENGYLVNVKASTDECKLCEVRVQSTKEKSWLCLTQLGLQSQIRDNNGELYVYDNVNRATSLISLKYIPHNWADREICSKTQFMDLSLRKRKQGLRIDFQKLRIQLKVLDIESKERVIYFDGTYCDTEYKLLNSSISVYNQPEEEDPVTDSQTLMTPCGVPIKMVDVDNVTERKICLDYNPSSNINCTSNWVFSVSVAGNSLNQEDMIYTLKCTDDKAHQAHTWCANSTMHRLTLIFQRSAGTLKSNEHPKMFQFVIRDYNRRSQTLMKEQHKIPEDNTTN